MAKPPWHRLYGLARWKRLREAQLNEQPLCVFCLEREDITPAGVVDHIKPHRGDEVLFWDPENLQSLCAPCHDRDKDRIEAGKSLVRFGADGWPVD